jgi:hypothetical protein
MNAGDLPSSTNIYGSPAGTEAMTRAAVVVRLVL